MKFKIVDVKAPRYTRTQHATKLSMRGIYKDWKEQGSDMDWATFKAMYIELFEVIEHFVTTERNGVVLPSQMGHLHLGLFKIKRKPYQFQLGMKTGYGPILPFFSTNSLQGKIIWDFKEVRYKLKGYQIYGFTGCRTLKRAASQAFINTPELFRVNVYRRNENRKKNKLERNERNNQRGDQSAEGAEQGS